MHWAGSRVVLGPLCGLWLALGAVGCGGDGAAAPLDPAQASPMELRRESLDAYVDQLPGPAPTGLAALPGHRLALTRDGALALFDGTQEHTLLESASMSPSVGAATFTNGPTVVATADAFYVVDDEARTSPLGAAVTGTVRGIAARRQALWIRTDRGLEHLQDSTLSQFLVEGQVLPGPFALGGQVASRPAMWVSDETKLLAVEALEGTAEQGAVLAHIAGKTQFVAVDSSGQMWAVVDGALGLWTDAGYRPIALDAEVTQLWGHPRTAGVWVLHGGRLSHVEGTLMRSMEVGDALLGTHAGAVDEVGRLLVANDQGLLRYAHQRALVVRGLQAGESVDAARPLTVEATDPRDLQAIEVTVGETVLQATQSETPGQLQVQLDPTTLGLPGDHELRAQATYADGTQVQLAALPFQTQQAGPVTWSTQVEPLYRARCAICHDSATATVLASQQDWTDNIDQILVELKAGRMPLAGGPLTEGQIAMIEAWQQGGFE